MSTLSTKLSEAVQAGRLLEFSQVNIEAYLKGSNQPVSAAAIEELIESENWSELNDRFFKTLAFGTGGLRGRTIGRTVTSVEQGAGGPNDRPEHPCVGSATLNFYNVGRAVRGMIAYLQGFVQGRKPRIVFAHDTRHFSRDFAEFCAKVCQELGVDAYLYSAARSTPQLSFTVRDLEADAGVVLTASHNPSHDNGFKAYFNDGAQIVPPHDKGIIDEVNAIDSESYEALAPEQQGSITILDADMDRKYMDSLKSLLLVPSLLDSVSAKVVYANIHGTGGHIIAPLMKELGFEVSTVAEQDVQDGRFPTVASPNPENVAALQMGVDLANENGADIVIGTDPDSDRMGVVVRNASGEMQLLTGNQIGSLMAWYRIKTMFDLGWLNNSNSSRATLIKTLVTTELQTAIANKFGISTVDTLTGFKYIAAKLGKYERAIPADKYEGDYRQLQPEQSRDLRLEYSKFFVFGGEESYGYLGNDVVRDKDANGAAVIFAEVAAYAQSIGKTLPELLDDIYAEFGYHLEKGHALTMEGADGAAKIKSLSASYSSNPPKEVDGSAVINVRDYAKADFTDQEGDDIPKAAMLFVDLEDGRSFAVRPSGTEPKIKYYLYGRDEAGTSDLNASKAKVITSLENLWSWLEADAQSRMG